MRWSELRAPAHGVRLHVRRITDPPAPPVVLLHGLGVSGAVWQSFARRLLPDLAAVAPDLRGHGQSDAPPSGYEPIDYAGDIAAVIEELDLAPVPVVGHSLGSLVALALADARPELMSWLALLDPPLDPELRNPEVPEVYRLRHAPPGELEAYLKSRGPGVELLAPIFRQAANAPFEALLEHTGVYEVPKIQQPCLVVQADPAHGGVLGDAAAKKVVVTLPRAELLKMVGASHAVHATHPAQLADAIRQWDRRARRQPDPDSRVGVES